MAVAKNNPVEEADPDHPQYQHGMEAGLSALAALPKVTDGSALAGLPRATDGQAPVPPSAVSAGATALPGLHRRTAVGDPINTGGGIGGLPRTAGPSPAVGGTQAVLPRSRNQSAIEQPDPANFFRRK